MASTAQRRTKSSTPKILYILRRQGEFGCNIENVEGHCNMKTGPVVLKYWVRIECRQVDDRKFVHAQESLEAYFNDIEFVTASCEALAAECAEEIRQQVVDNIRSENVRVSVEISPPPYVGSATAVIGGLE